MIKEIIKEELLEVYFQVIVSIRTKKIYAFEALTRCMYKNKNIPPDELFALAKKENLSKDLDELTRKMAIKKFYEYYKNDNNLVLFLNFESKLIEDFTNKDSFVTLISSLNIPFSQFVLEIKEDEINNFDNLQLFCKKYKEMGFSIALDDFGTGNSNFHRLNIIKPDIIKIDKSLLKEVKRNKVNKEIVKAISKMSHNLGIRVLAEGVEDVDAICLGMKSFVSLYQGYYFSKAKRNITREFNIKIIKKIENIGKIFKKRIIKSMTQKRKTINKFDLIALKMISNIKKVEKFSLDLLETYKKYKEIEAIYLIDASTSKQISDTIICNNSNNANNSNNTCIASKNGEEHYLKEYYYITLESISGIYLSQNYISYASGNICKTFAKKFSIENKFYIICLDIVIKIK